MKQSDSTIRFVLRAAALTTFVLGVGIVLRPDLIVSWFDGYSGNNYHFVRFIGTALIGFSVMNWLYSRFKTISAVLPAIYGNLTSLLLATAVDVVGALNGMLSRPAWLILIVHFIFTAAFIYCVVHIKRAHHT